MADYIDRSIICESYIYVENYTLTGERKEMLQGALREYARTRAPLFFGADIEIASEASEGSLKLKVTIVATLTNLFIFYGSLRQSIDYLYKDAQTVASAFVTESMFAAGVKSNDVGRTEVRTGVPGALKRVLSKMDVLEESSRKMPPEEFSADLAGIRAELKRIIDTIPSDQDKESVANGFSQILNEQYPVPAAPPQEEQGQIPAPILLRNEIEEFLNDLRRYNRTP
jgi:hypothetical protein